MGEPGVKVGWLDSQGNRGIGTGATVPRHLFNSASANLIPCFQGIYASEIPTLGCSPRRGFCELRSRATEGAL